MKNLNKNGNQVRAEAARFKTVFTFKNNKMNLLKSERIAGWVLASLLLVITLSSTFFFLVKLGVGVTDWIAFNACSPVSFLYLAFFAVFLYGKNPVWLVLPSLPIYYLGTLSMFVLPWSGSYITAHVGHVIMTANLAWVFYVVFRYRAYKPLATGLFAGMLVFAPFVAYVQLYNQNHAEEIARLFQQL